MNRGLYIGATSLVTNQRKLDVLSNDLANINTVGYKKDISITESFPEKLLAKVSREPELGNMIRENQIEYENIGGIHRAKTKEGYFTVNTSRGKSYVKEIQFVVDDEGYLKTSYKNLNDEYKTDYENFIIDRNGNPVQGVENIEGIIEELVTHTPAHVIGTMSGGVRFQKLFTDFTNSSLMDTGGKFDLALKGDGFFKVAVGEEIFYTRNGSFTVSNGYLSDIDGNRVLGVNGEIPINGGQVIVLPNGQVRVDDELVDILDVVNVNNREFLRKRGNNHFYMVENEEAEEGEFTGEILQGYLENSNMNPISGMVEMINLLREFEAGQKAIRMQDEMMEKAANEIGRI